MISKCRICRKSFDVLYPELWVYRRGSKWFCSWGCMRKYDRREEPEKEEAKERMARTRRDPKEVLFRMLDAVESGQDAKAFLAEEGYTNVEKAWCAIRMWARKNDPDALDRLDKLTGTKRRKPLVRTVKSDEVVNAITVNDDMAIAAKVAEKMNVPTDGPLKTAAVYSETLDGHTWKKFDGGMALVGPNVNLVLNAYGWFKLSEEIITAIRQLNITPETIPAGEEEEELDPEEYTGNNGPLIRTMIP